MPAQPLVVSPDTRPASLNVAGEQITVLASGAQTGSYEIFLQAGPEGSGPPPHSHPWDEAFYVLRGSIAFGINDQERIAETGTLVQLPAGTAHWFRFGAGGGEMLSLTSRAGAADFFAAVDREVAPQAPDLATLISIAMAHEVALAAPPR